MNKQTLIKSVDQELNKLKTKTEGIANMNTRK